MTLPLVGLSMCFMQASGIAALALGAVASRVGADSTLPQAELIPADVSWALVIPDVGGGSKRLEDAIARMDRPGLPSVGRPVDHLQAILEIPQGFNESGAIIAWGYPGGGSLTISGTEAESGRGASAGVSVERGAILLPIQQGVDVAAALLAAGGAKVSAEDPSVLEAERQGRPVFIRRAPVIYANDSYLLAASTAAIAREYAVPTTPLALPGGEPAVNRIASLIDGAEVILVTKPSGAAPAIPDEVPEEMRASARSIASLGADFDGTVISLDIDPMAMVVRWMACAKQDSALAALLAGGKGGERVGGPFDRLPKAAPYAAVCIDIAGLGGVESARSLSAAIDPTGAFLPPTLAESAEALTRLQAAAYPSKLGILAGGILNDSALVMECKDPDGMLALWHEYLDTQAGVAGTVRREVEWESGREVKDVGPADAFGVTEVPLGPSELPPDADGGAALPQDAMQMMVRRAIFGSKGMRGFARANSSALVVTFSRRPDVLKRAVEAASGTGDTLSKDPVIAGMLRMARMPGDVVAVVGVGQLVRAVRQVAGAFGGAGAGGILDGIDARVEPVLSVVDIDGGAVRGATIIPSSLAGVVLEMQLKSALPGPGGGAKAANEPPHDE